MAYGTLNVDSITTSTGQILGGGNATAFKNRIINGGMVIDQRNAGASITPTNGQYSVDRFMCIQSVASKYSAQQNAGAVTPPTGFKNYLGATSLSAYSVGSGDQFDFNHRIEANNLSDLGWGASGALSVTVSFWVRSSLTGTFGGSVVNAPTYNYSYPFSYTISSANTWEQKTVTIPGPTAGTWTSSGNDSGLTLVFGLGVGSSFSGTANAWASALYYSPTGATSVVGTSGATFYITGVQLEVGTQATSFDFRDYGRELILCQRYYQNVSISGRRSGGFWIPETMTGSNSMRGSYQYPVTMRTTPTGTITQVYLDGGYAGQSYTFDDGLGSGLSTNKAVILTTAYFVGGSGNYGTFMLTISLSAEL